MTAPTLELETLKAEYAASGSTLSPNQWLAGHLEALRPCITRCHYLNRGRVQCTAEAVDSDADILLCTHHLTRALQLIASHRKAGS